MIFLKRLGIIDVMDTFILISGDYNAFSTGYNGCGVYGISGVIPSSFETPIYIGSAVNEKRRVGDEHINHLRQHHHKNPPLQNYFDKNGLENLVFFHLESCKPEDLLKTEQKWIDYYGVAADKKAFNVLPIAGSHLGAKRSEETKKKISQSNTGRKRSPESIERMRKAHLGKKKPRESVIAGAIKLKEFYKNNKHPSKGKKVSPEIIEKRLKSACKFFKIMSPQGEILEGQNLHKFARERGLDSSNLAKVIKGVQSNHKGWTNADNPRERMRIKDRKVVWPSKDELMKLLSQNTLSKIARIYGVTFSSIKKWCKTLKIDITEYGYK